MSVAGGGG
ncbi:hypothetical protein YPPY91_1102, partial [Yersinia pestis PY-91]